MACEPGTCTPSINAEGQSITDCIQFWHSFGTPPPLCIPNTDPCNDLGGPISLNAKITFDQLENLFHNIGPNFTRLGHEDYRCFYIINSSTSDTIRNAIVYMDGTGRGTPGLRGGTYHAIGVKLENAIQRIAVTGPGPFHEGDFFTCKIPAPTDICPKVTDWIPDFQVQYDVNITKWQGNFQTAIRTVEGMSETVVVAEGTTTPQPVVEFTIYFGGHSTRNVGDKGSSDHQKWDQAAHHYIPPIVITQNNMLNGRGTVSVSVIAAGSPVNTTAEYIVNEITPPVIPTFNYYFRGNPIRVGSLRPQEFLPVWIRRTLPAPDPPSGPLARPTHTAFLREYFTIRVDGTYP